MYKTEEGLRGGEGVESACGGNGRNRRRRRARVLWWWRSKIQLDTGLASTGLYRCDSYYVMASENSRECGLTIDSSDVLLAECKG